MEWSFWWPLGLTFAVIFFVPFFNKIPQLTQYLAITLFNRIINKFKLEEMVLKKDYDELHAEKQSLARENRILQNREEDLEKGIREAHQIQAHHDESIRARESEIEKLTVEISSLNAKIEDVNKFNREFSKLKIKLDAQNQVDESTFDLDGNYRALGAMSKLIDEFTGEFKTPKSQYENLL